MIEEVDFLVLGAGLSGLAAANVLGEQAIVLERESRPGGLVRTECFNGYWFDHVLHLLYFADPKTESRIRLLLGQTLAPCPPEAWVETQSGTVRFPYQTHLSGLKTDTVARCIRDLAEATFSARHVQPANFEEMLERSFGRAMCEDFLFPYNRKQWKRPLDTLAATGFTWSIAVPDFEEVVQGALGDNQEFRAYNSKGWYPRPPKDSQVRGMEVVSRVLAKDVSDLRLCHSIESINLDERVVTARHLGQGVEFRFRKACLATLPLPEVVSICEQAPDSLLERCNDLTHNRVVMVAFSIRGSRVQGRGHWRYYSDESIIFQRLVYMHEFDPDMAPADGWGLMAEITEPAEDPRRPSSEILVRTEEDVRRVGALPDNCEIMDAHTWIIDPAYVVFTTENARVVEAAREFLQSWAIVPMGRYGRWEYSSMGQVMRDALTWAEEEMSPLP